MPAVRAAMTLGLLAGLPPISAKLEALDAKAFTAGSVTLLSVINVNHDTRLLRFKLPASQNEYRVPVSSCLACEVRHHGKLYRRYYTPINPVGSKGYTDLLVKLYPSGRMTPLMWNMKPGDKMRFQFWMKDQWKANKYDVVGMLAGGVGITPMLQIIREVVTNPYDHTKIKLLCVNKTEEDILLREEIDRLAAEYPNTLEVHHFLTRPTASWTGPRGTIIPKVIEKYMPPPSARTQIYVSGPHGFYQTLCGVGNSSIYYWTQSNSFLQPGIHVLDSQMDEDSMLYRMGYSMRQVSVF